MKYKLLIPLGNYKIGDVLETDANGAWSCTRKYEWNLKPHDILIMEKLGMLEAIKVCTLHSRPCTECKEEKEEDLCDDNCACDTPCPMECCEKGAWQPKEGDKYFYVSHNLHMVGSRLWQDNKEDDLMRKEAGNCFRTREAAQRACDKVKALLLSLPRE